MVKFLVIVLVALHKFKGEADGQKVKIIFNLLEDISFRADRFAWSEVLSILMKAQSLEETLTVDVHRELTVRDRGWRGTEKNI